MTWFPRGPDTVVAARRPNYTRLSRRNEWGNQCLVEGIAVHAVDPLLIAVIVRRVGGSTAFRSFDGGRNWQSIADEITRPDAQCDLTCVALHPTRRDVVYLGGGSSRRVYVLRDGSVPTSQILAGRVTQLIVDRASADLDSATIYAATTTSLAVSSNGGTSWTEIPLGNVQSLAIYQPLSGARRFYAGVRGVGLMTATAVSGPWLNHFGLAGNGLPSPLTTGSYEHAVYVDISPRQPERVYLAVFEAARPPGSGFDARRIFMSTSPFPHALWQEHGTGVQPTPDGNFDGVQLVVAPENIGADTSDVLLFTGPILLQRSTDGGRTWQFGSGSHLLHSDTRAFGYWPTATTYYPDTLSTTGTPPRATIFVGSDGGIASTTGYTNAAFLFADEEPSDSRAFNEGPVLSAAPGSGVPQSLNRSLQALAIHRYSSNSSSRDGGPMSVIGYASTLDTGYSRHLGSTAWASVRGGEGGPLIARSVAGGVRVWDTMSFSSFVGWPMETWLDTDGAGPSTGGVVLLADGSNLRPTSRVIPSSSGGVIVGAINMPTAAADRRAFVARVDETGLATRISQTRSPDRRTRFNLITQAGDSLLATTIDQRVWLLTGAAAAGPASVWTEVTGLPSGLASPESADWIEAYWAGGPNVRGSSPMIAGITADAAGTFYVLLTDAVDVASAGGVINTPLLRVDGTSLRAEVCTLPPAAAIPEGVVLGETVSHPSTAGVLFASRNGRVFRLASTQAGWTWTDLTENLPGPEIHDLWIGNIAPTCASPRYILRAATAVRGVWEREVESSGSTAIVYLRDHVFDAGWLPQSADGVMNPLRVGERAWHFQSPDIKVDTPELTPSGTRYYQNDPEAPTLTPSEFAWIKDDSTDAAAGERARVWVQVHGRSFPRTALRLNVWAITCRVSGVVPRLPARGTESFWTRFLPDGSIDTSGIGGGWISLGVRPIEGVDGANSKVVQFEFDTVSMGDHRCIAVFVHGPGALLQHDGFSESLDECVPRSPQVAQRNVEVGRPLASRPRPDPGVPGPPPTSTGPGGTAGLEMRRLVAFNNPHLNAITSTIEFDLRTLPPAVGMTFRLSENCRPTSIIGCAPEGRKARTGCLGLLTELPLIGEAFSWLFNLLGWSGSATREPALSPTVWRGENGRQVLLQDIPLPAQGSVFAEVVFQSLGELPEGRRYAVDLLQHIENKVAGGVTIILQTAGLPPPIPAPDEDDEREIAGMVNKRFM